MRLTLRTLLAYMDEILEPGDREELAKKVESSDFANDLVLRTKDTMRRLRLSAPQVIGTGMALDPNTVAEYLDNVLPPDSVADFERICLESDVHLAEVASAHHVLTMVLGEAADVDPLARQRMYAIPAEAERRKQAHVEPPRAPVVAERAAVEAPPRVSSAASTFAATPDASEIPDYLRASAWSGSRLALGALAAALLIAIGALFLFSLDGWKSEPIAMNSGGAATSAIQSPPAAVNEIDATESPTSAPIASDETPSAESEMAGAPPRFALPAMPSATETPSQEPPAAAPPAELAETASDEVPPTTEPDRYAVTEGSETANSVPTDSVPTTGAPTPLPPQPSELVTPTPPETAPSEVAPRVAPPAATDETPRVASSDVQPATGADTIAPADPAAVELEVPPAEAIAELGSYLDGKNILLRYDPEEQVWFRMPARTMLHRGDRLLALPAFHPKLTLASGLYLKLAGGTLVTMGDGTASSEPELDVEYGRVVIINTANNENRVQLKLGSTSAEARLQPNATLAVEVVPSYVPGHDPRQSPSSKIINLYARDGSVVWQDATGGETIEAPSAWTITDGVASDRTPEPTIPDWIDHEPVEQRSEQLYGAPAVEVALEPSRPVEEQLLELYQGSKRREVKSLAARSSMYVGQFVPFVEALRDSDQKSTWKTHIETLRSAMSQGPKSAEKIWETLVEQRGEEAARDLYEMLCGYSQEQVGTTPDEVQHGALVTLIDRLEEDSLDYRVLAAQDLWEITGMRLMPNPAGTPVERARGVRIWRERLKSGEVMPVAQSQ